LILAVNYAPASRNAAVLLLHVGGLAGKLVLIPLFASARHVAETRMLSNSDLIPVQKYLAS